MTNKDAWILGGFILLLVLFVFFRDQNTRRITEAFKNQKQKTKSECSQKAIDEGVLTWTFGKPQMVPRVLA